jgi:hypothetical protein
MSPESTDPDPRKPYHHGSLRSALIEASIALAREGGPDRVILREAARAAGVSHSAAYPRHRLRAVGTAYIQFALAEPGLFRTAFTSHPATSGDTPNDRATGGLDREDTSDVTEPFEVLGQVLDEAQAVGLLDPRRRPGAEIAVWSAVHGLAGLLLDGPLPTSDEAIKFAWQQVQALVERGLLNG